MTLHKKIALNSVYGAFGKPKRIIPFDKISMKASRMDGRHRGFPDFKFKVIFTNQKGQFLNAIDRTAQFLKVRQWFIETYGTSCEYEYHRLTHEFYPDLLNENWSWYSDNKLDMRIFMKDEKVYNWFMMRWNGS